MPILAAFALPHPPILLPEVGQGEERKLAKTALAYAQIVRRVGELAPDVLIITSPHATQYADYFHISPGSGASGSLTQFNAPAVALTVAYDRTLVRHIEKIAKERGLPAGTMGERIPSLDHGSLIPLWLLNKAGVKCPVVRIGISGLPALSHYQFGACIAQAVDLLDRRAVLIASGDLSHKLSESGPYGFAPEGAAFDQQITDALQTGDFGAMLSVSPDLADAAAECGLRSFYIMAGALDHKTVNAALLSYEGPFGVGYAVAAYTVGDDDNERSFGEKLERARQETLHQAKAHEDDYVRLARQSLETYVRNGTIMPLPDSLAADLRRARAGVFVSLKKDGLLRGCIGTTEATTDCIGNEIIRNAISAASSDPRFEPVREDELDELLYHVDVLGAPELISSPAELEPKRYGVIVQNGMRRGLLLPDLEGIDTAERQVEIARRKGGIQPDETVRLYRFEVVRHH